MYEPENTMLTMMISEHDGDMNNDEECLTESDVMNLTQKDESESETNHDEEEGDVESDDDDVEEIKERTFRSCLRSRPCSICLYLCITLFLMASIVSLIVIGVLIVAPYNKASGFQPTICTAVGSSRDAKERRCSCGKGCTSAYPCSEVRATHSLLRDPVNVIVYENEATLRRQCSYYPPCKSSRPANEKAVKDYEDKYGSPGKTYPCLYNPDNPTEVIRTRRFRLEHVIHGMVWSSLVFILSLLILIFAIKKKGCDFL